MQIISLGAGVQSTALTLMAARGEFGSVPDGAIFADTQWEPAGVYRHLNWLEWYLHDRIPVYRVTAGNIRDDTLAAVRGEGLKFAVMPFRLRSEDGKKGMLRRQCTKEYKVAPIRRKLRELLGGGKVHGMRVRLWIGISTDEADRMKESDRRYIEHIWPLIDRGMSRQDCIDWLIGNGFSVPPKSACIGCPFHDNATWINLATNHPIEFQDAVVFDRATRRLPRINGEVFLHRNLLPLDEAVKLTVPVRETNDFRNDCEGMCGV